MQTFIRTVDNRFSLYVLGRAVSHEEWQPGQQVRLTLDDKGIPVNAGVFFALANPKVIQQRIQSILRRRTHPFQCSVIDLNDNDGFEQRQSRIFSFHEARKKANARRLSHSFIRPEGA